jgi:hypothetical protein
MEEYKTLQELWALPVNMKPLPYDFYGHQLYSSEKLKLKFFEAILATQWGKYHAKNLYRLIQRDFIVPAIMNKGILSFLAKKFLSVDWSKAVQGLYDSRLKKVIVFIDNSSTWMGLSSNKILVKTTLHECMHLAANSNENGFFKIMKPTFTQYYGGYFSDIFSCEKINIEKVLKQLLKIEGVFSQPLHKKYMAALRDATENETSLDEMQYDNIFGDIFTMTRIFPLSPNLIMRYYPKYYHILSPLNKAYINTFNERNSYTTPVQELWVLSEVASVMSELLPVDRRVSNLLSNIK